MIRVEKCEKGVALKDKGKSAREGATSHKMTSRPTGIDWTLSSKKTYTTRVVYKNSNEGNVYKNVCTPVIELSMAFGENREILKWA